jgi:hypothetical protein
MVWKKAVVAEFDAVPRNMIGGTDETMINLRHCSLLHTTECSRLCRNVLWGVGDDKKNIERIRNQHNENHQEKTCRLHE